MLTENIKEANVLVLTPEGQKPGSSGCLGRRTECNLESRASIRVSSAHVNDQNKVKTPTN